MGYKKGDIFFYDYPQRQTKELERSKVIEDGHRVVVLHTRETPYKTILVAPITGAEALDNRRSIPENYVKLDKSNYPFVLTKDSFINLDHIMPIDEVELRDLELRGKKITAKLKEADLYAVDFKLMLTYEMQGFFENEVALEQNQNMKTIIEHINVNVKNQIEILLDKLDVKDDEKRKEFIDTLDSLISIMNQYYVNENAQEGSYLK